MVKRMTFKQFVFILPLLLFICVFSFYPIVTSFMYSLFDYRNNDQSYNSFYISEQFNGSLFQEDYKYVNYFLNSDITLVDEADQGELAAIQGEISAMMESFFRITLPLMKPSIMVALLFRTLDSFRVFDLLTVLTGGGPGNGTETLSIYSNKLIFSQSNYGYGSAVVIGMFVCVAIIAFIYIKVLGADVISSKTS